MARKLLTGADLNNQRLINLADASSPTDAVTLQQLQAAIRGLDWKQSVRAATTANITLSGTQTIDGVTLAAGDRVLVKDQSTASANGLYAVSSGAWTRTLDADDNTEITAALAVTVESGTVNGDKVYLLVTDGPITIGTTALTFTQLGGSSGTTYTGGNGINISGSVISGVVKAGGGIIVDSTGFYIDASVVTRKYAQNIGDGSATTFTVTHNLATRDITVGLQNTTSYELVDADIVATTANAVTVTFAAAPASGAYRITVHG